MTEIEKKALALVSEVLGVRLSLFERSDSHIHEALCRAIEKHEADKAAHAATIEGILKAHEAYKQEVSDAVESYLSGSRSSCILDRFILPKPDPLVEAVGEAMQQHELYSKYELADSLRIILTKRGLKIVETGQ